MSMGAWLAVDYGQARIGVAATDPGRVLAFPVVTIAQGPDAAAAISEIAAEREVTVIFVGLPRHLSGKEGASATAARAFGAKVAELSGVSVRLIDERFSTVSAAAQLNAAGRNTRSAKAIIDQAAAVVILEHALDLERQGNLEKSTIAVSP